MTSEATPPTVPPATAVPSFALRFSVDYPDRVLDRFSSFFRILFGIPIVIVSTALSGRNSGIFFLAPLLMIVFRQKYPRWWFDFSVDLMRFQARVWTYLALMTDRYPSTDEYQHVHLEADYPDVQRDLNRWLPLVKWLLALPHYIMLIVLVVGAVFAVIFAWFAILFTGRYPRGLFNYIEGVARWANRVMAYAFLLNTDKYPPFQLS